MCVSDTLCLCLSISHCDCCLDLIDRYHMFRCSHGFLFAFFYCILIFMADSLASFCALCYGDLAVLELLVEIHIMSHNSAPFLFD